MLKVITLITLALVVAVPSYGQLDYVHKKNKTEWNIIKQTDPMTDEVSSLLVLYSEETNRWGKKPAIIVSCDNSGTVGLSIGINDFISSNGNNLQVSYRIGSDKPENEGFYKNGNAYTWTVYNEGCSITRVVHTDTDYKPISDYELVRKMMNADKFVFRVDVDYSSSITVSFDTSELAKAMNELSRQAGVMFK